jgi:threonine dehydrogenase-like Zn-dependent dehydrogenase
MSDSMRAAVITRPGSIEVVASPLPRPQPGQVRLRLEGSGVCASNLPLWQGAEWFTYPMPPGQGGHEAWGRVEAAGCERGEPWLGKRVAALSYRAYAECDLARVDDLVEIPAQLADAPCPGEALGCAMNIFRRSAIEPGMSVAIVGVGFLGALLTRIISHAGARVLAISRRAHALQLAQAWGARASHTLGDRRATIDWVRELNAGQLCDRVIEATGKQEPLTLAAELTREHGRLMIAGYHQDGPRSVDMQLWNYRGLDVINAHERDPAVSLRGMREALSAIEAGWLDPTPLYSHQFELDQLGAAFEHTRERPDGFMKALIRTGAKA